MPFPHKYSLQAPGGGGTPLYKLYRCVLLHRVGFLRRFGLKTGIHFAHFGLESTMLFEGTTGCMNVIIVSIPNIRGGLGVRDSHLAVISSMWPSILLPKRLSAGVV